MCQEIKSIDKPRSRKWLKRKGRRTLRIFVQCPHGVASVFSCNRRFEDGWRSNGQASAKYLAFADWPEIVKAFVVELLTPKPAKPKRASDPMQKALAAKVAAAEKLAEWTRRQKAASTKVRQYATKLRRAIAKIEQLAVTPTAGSSAASRRFDL